MSERQFFIRQGEKVQGPFAEERLRGWIAAGRVRPEMELSEDGATFRRGAEFAGLFDASAPEAPPDAPPEPVVAKRRRSRDEEEAPRRSLSSSRPPAPASIVVIGCRILGAIALIAALAVGQWAYATRPMGTPGSEARVVFGLSTFESGDVNGGVFTPYGAGSYASNTFTKVGAPPEGTIAFHSSQQRGLYAGPAGTSHLLGMAIWLLALLSILLTLGSFGEFFGRPGLARLGAAALLVSIAATLLGWMFTKSGLVDLAIDAGRIEDGGRFPAKASGGFSFYTSILAVLLLAIAWTRSRVVAMDAARRVHRPPPPKRRQRRGESA